MIANEFHRKLGKNNLRVMGLGCLNKLTGVIDEGGCLLKY